MTNAEFNWRAVAIHIASLALTTFLLSVPLHGQPATQAVPLVRAVSPQQATSTTYINESTQVVSVLSTPSVPNGQPSVIRQLQPGESYQRQQNIVGASISFQLANGGQVEQRTRPNHIGLVAFGGSPRPVRQGTTYVNRTGETINIFEQRGVTIPPTPPAFFRSLQPNQTWTDGPTRVSPLSFKLSSGTGTLREVIEQTPQGQMTAFVKIADTPTPAPANITTTYINRTGQNVQVFSQPSGAPGFQQPAQLETTIPPSGIYRIQSMPGSPNKKFQLANGGRVDQTTTGNNTIQLIIANLPNPGGQGQGTTYVNKTGQQVHVYSQQAGAPGFRQPAQYETTIQNGGSYFRQSIPGAPSKTFRLANGGNLLQRQLTGNKIELVATGMPTPGGGQPIPDQPGWGPWKPVPGGGTIEWKTIPGGTIEWEVVPNGGQWQTVPGGQWQTIPGNQWQTVPGSQWQVVPGSGVGNGG